MVFFVVVGVELLAGVALGRVLIVACCWLEELITDIANAMNNYYKLMKIIVFLAN